jgi:hypothetical protein
MPQAFDVQEPVSGTPTGDPPDPPPKPLLLAPALLPARITAEKTTATNSPMPQRRMNFLLALGTLLNICKSTCYLCVHNSSIYNIYQNLAIEIYLLQ